MNNECCSDIRIFGNCILGINCKFCNLQNKLACPTFNLNAKEFIPKTTKEKNLINNNIYNHSKKPEESNLNINANEFTPSKNKKNSTYGTHLSVYKFEIKQPISNLNDDIYYEPNKEEIKFIFGDIIDNIELDYDNENT